MLPNIKCFSVKSTPSGHLMTQEAFSNDLVVHSSLGKEIARFNAATRLAFTETSVRNAHFTGELEQVLWFSGSNEVTVVELADLRMIEIKNFLPASSNGKETVALRAVMREKGQYIVVAFIVDNNFGLAYQFPGVREPNIYLLTEILPNCRF
jgi:hypothetical protein